MRCSIVCPKCRGCGRVRLSLAMQRTLNQVPTKGERSTSVIFGRLRETALGQTAIVNRLTALEKCGLVKSRREWRTRFWRRTL